MLTKPSYGWTSVYIKGSDLYFGTASNATDIPYDMLRAFWNYFSLKSFQVEFVCENHECGFIIFDNELYFVSNENKVDGLEGITITNKQCGLPEEATLLDKMIHLAKELISDIRKYINEWAEWSAYYDGSSVEYTKEVLIDLILDIETCIKVFEERYE